MKIKVIGRGMSAGGALYEFAPGYVFTKDAACEDYDWLVVYDEMETRDVGTLQGGCEKVRCSPEHTILATCEPTSIKSYSRAYTRQFARILTNRPYEAERHPGYYLGRGYYDWLTERSPQQNAELQLTEKTKMLSVVCSGKRMTHTKHAARFNLITEMAKAIPELDWFGHGVRECPNKCAVLDPYKYHLALENHIAPHHWSEKVADALLCECLPFYAGAPDLADDLPSGCFIPIPLDDPKESIDIVRSAMESGEYERRKGDILKAKRLLLERYNFWSQVIEVIKDTESHARAGERFVGSQVICDRKLLRRKSLGAALEDGWFHFKQYVRI